MAEKETRLVDGAGCRDLAGTLTRRTFLSISGTSAGLIIVAATVPGCDGAPVSTPAALVAPDNNASGDEADMCKARAQAFLAPGFASYFNDYTEAVANYADSAFGADASQQVYVLPGIGSGFSGGGKIRYRVVNATGFHFQTLGPQAAQQPVLTQSQTFAPWYFECGAIVLAVTGPAELGLIGVYVPESPMTNTDGGGGAYLSLGVFGATSNTTLSIRMWDGTTLAVLNTGVDVELGVERRYALCNDGLGTLWVLRDGVVIYSTPRWTNLASAFPGYVPSALVGSPMVHERANSGTVDVVRDYVFAAGQRY